MNYWGLADAGLEVGLILPPRMDWIEALPEEKNHHYQ